jgi:hypothetical protein
MLLTFLKHHTEIILTEAFPKTCCHNIIRILHYMALVLHIYARQSSTYLCRLLALLVVHRERIRSKVAV